MGFDEKLAPFDETGLNAKERHALRNSADYHKKSMYNDILAEFEFQTDYAGYLESVDKAASSGITDILALVVLLCIAVSKLLVMIVPCAVSLQIL